MLVDFSVSQWTARKIDKKASADLTDAANAHAKSAHVSKKLVASSLLTEINNVVMQTRLHHMHCTSPWFDNGSRILHISNHEKYRDGMERGEAKFADLVPRFVAEYPLLREQAANEYVALGKLWNGSDYPAVERIAHKFAWRTRTLPIPNEADFRADIGQDAIDRVRADISAVLHDRAAAAAMNTFSRVHEVVAHMVESLDAYQPSATGKDKGTFRDTLVGNIRDLIDVMPGLNFANDKRVSQLIADMQAITEHEAEDLRIDAALRRDVTAKAKEIVTAVSDFMA
jgi:hypothetical protein